MAAFSDGMAHVQQGLACACTVGPGRGCVAGDSALLSTAFGYVCWYTPRLLVDAAAAALPSIAEMLVGARWLLIRVKLHPHHLLLLLLLSSCVSCSLCNLCGASRLPVISCSPSTCHKTYPGQDLGRLVVVCAADAVFSLPLGVVLAVLSTCSLAWREPRLLLLLLLLILSMVVGPFSLATHLGGSSTPRASRQSACACLGVWACALLM